MNCALCCVIQVPNGDKYNLALLYGLLLAFTDVHLLDRI